MDFYWHYSGKETVDEHGKENFCRAINVAKQVFNTLTEYIQVRDTATWRASQEVLCLGPLSTESTGIGQ